MKYFLPLLAVLLLVIAGLNPAWGAGSIQPPGVGDYFPPFAGLTPDGQEFDLAEHYNAGMYILIDFWAAWCGPCVGEIPNLVEAWNEFGGDKFLILGVNMDRPSTEEKMHNMIEELGMMFPIITELGGWDTSFSRNLGIRYIPQNFLLAPDGTVLFRDLRGDDVMAILRPLMSLKREYKPIVMNIDVQDDPRDAEGFVRRPPAGDYDILIKPFTRPLNIAPEEIRLRFAVDNPQAGHFEAVLWYKLYRPTGRRTHLVKDKLTGEVIKHYLTGRPYIVYEVVVEEQEVIIDGWDGQIDTGYAIPVGEDVWEVQWGLKTHSPWLGIELSGADDYIDFAGYFTTTPDRIEDQGGIVFERDGDAEQ